MRVFHFLNASKAFAFVMETKIYSPTSKHLGNIKLVIGVKEVKKLAYKTYSALQIANYFLLLSNENDEITNLKLQKLCYYAQSLISAMRDAPLFREKIYAWDHGPVVKDLYHYYKDQGSNPIPPDYDLPVDTIDPVDKEVLDDIFSHYNQYSAWTLRNQTHEEKPWKDVHSDNPGGEIRIEDMISFFKPQINEEYAELMYGKEKF